MDADRFDTLAKRMVTPATRRATLRAVAAGGFLSALGLTRAVPETRAAQRGSCVLAFVATVRQGPSVGQALTPTGSRPGELRGELSFSLSATGNLEEGALTLPDGASFPVVGQATGHALQIRIEVGERVALVAVGVGEQEVAACQGAIDGIATGPDIGDLGDWHAAALRQAGGAGGANAGGNAPKTRTGRIDSPQAGTTGNGGAGGAEPKDRPGRKDSTAPAVAAGSTAGMGTDTGSCAAGLKRCGNACVDLKTDVQNCGACSSTCPAPTRCIDGACICPGVDGFACAGVCVDRDSDPKNCGACNTVCESGKCSAGTCQPLPPGPCAEQGASCAIADCCLGFCGQDDTCDCVSDGSECAHIGTGGCCSGEPCNPDGFCGVCGVLGAACAGDGDCCSGNYAAACCEGVCTDVTNIGFTCPCAQQGESCTTVSCCVGFCGQDDTCDCISDGQECRGNGDCCNGVCNADGFCGVCSVLGAGCNTDGDCCQGNYAAACCFDGTTLTTRCMDVTNIGFVCPGEPTGPVTCAAGLTDCGGECVDLFSNAGDCGTCGVSCGLGGVCTNGVCGAPQPTCLVLGSPCTLGVDICCEHNCMDGVCQCAPAGVLGANPGECCSGNLGGDGYCL